MAGADYYLCDLCGNKCFYDSNLNWDYNEDKNECVRGRCVSLDHCGDMACICKDCAKTHEVVIVKLCSVEGEKK